MTLTPASLRQDAPGKTVFVNKELHAEVKAVAKRKFKVYPSAYANAWMVREYKKRGGKFRNDGLDKWFKEKWVRMSSSGRILGPCGDRSEGKVSLNAYRPPRPCRFPPPNAAAWCPASGAKTPARSAAAPR